MVKIVVVPDMDDQSTENQKQPNDSAVCGEGDEDADKDGCKSNGNGDCLSIRDHGSNNSDRVSSPQLKTDKAPEECLDDLPENSNSLKQDNGESVQVSESESNLKSTNEDDELSSVNIPHVSDEQSGSLDTEVVDSEREIDKNHSSGTQLYVSDDLGPEVKSTSSDTVTPESNPGSKCSVIVNGTSEIETVELLDDAENESDVSVAKKNDDNDLIVIDEKPVGAANLNEHSGGSHTNQNELSSDVSKETVSKSVVKSKSKVAIQVPERRKTTRIAAQKAGSVIKKYAMDEMTDVFESDADLQVTHVSTPQVPGVKIPLSSATSSSGNSRTCLQCKKNKICRYPVIFQGSLSHICDDQCMSIFKSHQAITSVKPLAPILAKPKTIDNVRRACSFCGGNIFNKEKCLTWETMEFCKVECLEKYQVYVGSACCQCKKSCNPVAIGKYCVRFGENINQFCSNHCLDMFKRGLKLCSYCQRNISLSKDVLSNEKTQYQNFCSPMCFKKYQDMNNSRPDEENMAICVVCKQIREVQIKVLTTSNATIDLCSEPCMLAYKFTNQMVLACCGLCQKYFDQNAQLKSNKILFVINFSGNRLHFCCQTCFNVYITVNRKIVHCNKCNVRKYNFDMIEKVDSSGQLLMYCSLSCIGVNVNVPALRSQATKTICCDGCHLPKKLNFNVSMADGSMKNLCSQACVVKIQELSKKKLVAANVMNKFTISAKRPTGQVPVKAIPMPTITATASIPPARITPVAAVEPRELEVPDCPPQMKNKSVMCQPVVEHKEIDCQPNPELVPLVTEKGSGGKAYIPLPVPLYVPAPTYMFNYPYPQPVPIPIPIPVPIFIPIPADSYSSVMQSLKELNTRSEDSNSINLPNSSDSSSDSGKISVTRASKRKAIKRNSQISDENDLSKKAKITIDSEDDVENSSPMRHTQNSKSVSGSALKFTYGIHAWRQWILQKNSELEKAAHSGHRKLKLFKTQLLSLSPEELDYSLCLFVKEVRKPNGEEYAPDSIFYLCLGIQEYLFENGITDNIFTDNNFTRFTDCLDDIAKKFTNQISSGELRTIVTRIEEEQLWECKQLGAHSPHVLINTLIYFNTKYFFLKTVEEHLSLSFNQITKIWKKSENADKQATKYAVLRYVKPKQKDNSISSTKLQSYDQAQNLENLVRCPVKLYEFYLSKCPPNIKSQNDVYYLFPERSCLPDSDVWYSKNNLSCEVISKMLNRVLMVKEINESLMR